MSTEEELSVMGRTKDGKKILVTKSGKVIIIDKKINPEKEDKSNRFPKLNFPFKRKPKSTENDKVDIIIVGNKVNEHYSEFIDSKKDAVFNVDGTQYNIDKDSLYKMDKTFKEQFLSFIHWRKIDKRFIVFYDKDKISPKVIDTTEPKISSKIIYVAINSTVTARGIRSVQFGNGFSLPLNAKTLIMIVVGIGIAVAVYYMYTQGMIHI